MDLLTSRQVQSLSEVFGLFDHSGEGRLDAKALGTVLRALGQNPTQAEVQDIIAEVDSDGSGMLDQEEFLNMMAGRLRDSDVRGEVEDAFTAFDKDSNGAIGVEDLRAAAAELGEDIATRDLEEMVAEADLESKGEITFDSFHKLMTSN